MAGRFHYPQPESGKVERIAVFHRNEGVLRLGSRPEVDGCAATVTQFQMAGEEVGMKVCQEDVADLEAEFLGVGEIMLDIALRIYNDGRGTGFISQEIRSVGQAAEIVLFQHHKNFTSAAENIANDEAVFAGMGTPVDFVIE